MSNKGADIYSRWKTSPLPKQKGNFELFQYRNTNLWVLKNSVGGFGFLITGTMSKLDSDYKNIVSEWKNKLTSKTGQTLNRCLIIESKDSIDSKLFCSAISSLFEVQNSQHLFKINEIEDALKKIEEITLRENDEFNQVVGVWGELFLLNELIKLTKRDDDKLVIIESWEGVETRTKIDFNFKSKKTKIEVKTTTESVRNHHFNGLDQVSKGLTWNGYLASFCINPDEGGLSCNDLVNSIKESIPIIFLPYLESKLKHRGVSCNNTKHKFVINSSKKLEFFDFSQVPKPTIEDGVGKIEWNAILDNKQFLNIDDTNDLLNLMN
jgi:hypothetical protein